MNFIRKIIVYVSVFFILGNVITVWAELRLLLSIFRHGDRYPIAYNEMKHVYPLNPHANVSWFPDSVAGLTMEGKRQAFDHGQILRKQYGKWLGPIYSKKFVEFHSSHVERNIVTSSLVAAGLFPPRSVQRWNPQLDWQPIPILPIPLNDNLLYHGVFCLKYQSIYNDTQSKDPTMIKYNKDMKEFYDYISQHTGGPIDNRFLYYLYSEFLAARSGGLPLPAWTEKIFPEGKLKEAAKKQYQFYSWTDELKRYTGGVWLQKWLEHVDTYLRSNNPNKKFEKKAFFYGGHDVNIAGIMMTLGIFNPHIPKYTSSLSFELHEESRHFYVKVLHKESDKFIEKFIPGCNGILCSLNIFRNIFTKVIPWNETMECGTIQY